MKHNNHKLKGRAFNLNLKHYNLQPLTDQQLVCNSISRVDLPKILVAESQLHFFFFIMRNLGALLWTISHILPRFVDATANALPGAHILVMYSLEG